MASKKTRNRTKQRKYSNDFCRTVANRVASSTIGRVAEQLNLKYHDVQYINQEYYRRMRNGEYGQVTVKSKPTGRVYLKPRVVGYKDMATAWQVINGTFNDDQLDIIHKFYNTVLYATNSLQADDINKVTYEQV